MKPHVQAGREETLQSYTESQFRTRHIDLLPCLQTHTVMAGLRATASSSSSSPSHKQALSCCDGESWHIPYLVVELQLSAFRGLVKADRRLIPFTGLGLNPWAAGR